MPLEDVFAPPHPTPITLLPHSSNTQVAISLKRFLKVRWNVLWPHRLECVLLYNKTFLQMALSLRLHTPASANARTSSFMDLCCLWPQLETHLGEPWPHSLFFVHQNPTLRTFLFSELCSFIVWKPVGFCYKNDWTMTVPPPPMFCSYLLQEPALIRFSKLGRCWYLRRGGWVGQL